jgi:hypothetical protein
MDQLIQWRKQSNLKINQLNYDEPKKERAKKSLWQQVAEEIEAQGLAGRTFKEVKSIFIEQGFSQTTIFHAYKHINSKN